MLQEHNIQHRHSRLLQRCRPEQWKLLTTMSNQFSTRSLKPIFLIIFFCIKNAELLSITIVITTKNFEPNRIVKGPFVLFRYIFVDFLLLGSRCKTCLHNHFWY